MLGGPNKYYDYKEKTLIEVFEKIKNVANIISTYLKKKNIK